MARHRLRLALRRLREAKGPTYTQGEVARSLDWSLSKLQRIEAGDNAIAPTDLRALLNHLGVSEAAEVADMVTLAKTARTRGRWDDAAYRDHLTGPTRDLLEFESEARAIRTFQTILIPGVLQTKELAEVVINAWGQELTREQREVRLEVRLGRRAQLFERPDRPDYHLVLDESVLYRVMGGRRIFADQLRRLLTDARDGLIRLRIAPFEVAASLAQSLPFVVVSLDDEGDVVLYRENYLIDEIVQVPDRVQRYLDIFEQFWDQSFDEDATAHLVETRITHLLSTPDRGPTPLPDH